MPIVIGPSHIVAQMVVKATLAAGAQPAEPVSSIFHYRWSAGPGTKNKLALSNAFLAGPYAAMLAAFNQDYTLGSTNIRFLDDVLDPILITSLAGAGAIATDRQPSYNAVYMRRNSAVRGKRYQSSIHFPAVNEIDTTEDILTGAGLARWQTVQTAIAATLTDANLDVWIPCNVAFSISGIRTSPESVWIEDVAQVVLNKNLGTMKKRKIARVV